MIIRFLLIILAWIGWMIYFRDWFRRYEIRKRTEVHTFEKSKFTVVVKRW